MRFSTLYNNTVERRRVTYSHVWWNNAFNTEELDAIEEMCSLEQLDVGVTVAQGEDQVLEDIRRSKVKFIERSEERYWIFERFNLIGQSLNNQFYGFDLNGYDNFQYTVYDEEDQGTYDWHMDLILGTSLSENMWKQSTRKLTMIMLLSDENNFTGGEFQIHEGRQDSPITIEQKRGKIICFPSFISHRVTPVLSGQRKSIVIWIEGPKFI